jgi:SIR2-like domain
MQFVKDGPDLPDSLLHEHEDGRIVFFCGAGISYPAGLPGFRRLVELIYTELPTTPTELEAKALEQERFDAAVDLLEHRFPGGRFAVRGALAAVLKPKLRLLRATSTHKALLTLARDRKKNARLITTNFDRIFETVMRDPKLRMRTYQAPLVPIPKDSRWNGLVYLHGLLPRAVTEYDLNQLVVSSGDFGRAYLTERWAARFVGELFRRYIVCFVGYSIGDPVLRYMMDALAADRVLGEKTLPAYAFADYTEGNEEDVENLWRAKHVTPILYRVKSPAHDHSNLHLTLEEWANTHRDGVNGKEQIVIRHALAKPSGSTSQDDYVGRLLWALSDSRGLPAKRFAELDPLPSLDWLTPMWARRFRHGDLIRFGVSPNLEIDGKLEFSLLFRPSPYTLSPSMSLLGSAGYPGKWDDVMWHIARWLVRHLNDPTLVLWFAARGGQLHPQLDQLVRNELTTSPSTVSGHMKKLWRLLLADHVRSRLSFTDIYQWFRDLNEAGYLSPALRERLRACLRPLVKLGKPLSLRDAAGSNEAGELRIKDLVDWDIVLATEYVNIAVRDSKSEIWQSSAYTLLSDFVDLLRQAFDLMSELDGASEDSDFSYIHQPSIADHDQNKYFEEWTPLVALVREAWIQTAERDVERARLEAERWQSYRYPIFRRLTFFAATFPLVIPVGRALLWLLERDGWWLWTSETQREALELLTSLLPRLTEDERLLVEARIIQGPPRAMFKADVTPPDWVKIVDRMIYLRLSTWSATGVALPTASTARLAEIQARNPTWSTTALERQQFPYFMKSGFGPWGEAVAVPTELAALVVWLRQHPHSNDFEHDDWQNLCRSDTQLAASAVLQLAHEDFWPVDRWREALQAWSDETLKLTSWDLVHADLHSMPDNFIHDAAHPLIRWLQSLAESTISAEDNWTTLIESILRVFKDEAATEDEDPVGRAINHPVGQAVQAVLDRWYQSKLEDNQKLPGRLKAILTEVSDRTIGSYRHGRLILAQNAITLFRVDPDWASAYVLPLFDWGGAATEAKSAWEGFLWTPRIYQPLLEKIKAGFLATATHYAEIGKHAEQYSAFLTYVALEQGMGPFSKTELANATAELPDDGLKRAARALVSALKSSAEKRADYWTNRVKPYLQGIWPQHLARKTMAISHAFAELCVAAGESFHDAFSVLRGWLQPLRRPDTAVRNLDESQACERFPAEALQFLAIIVGENAEWPPDRLPSCLRKISIAAPMLIKDPSFEALMTYVRRKGPGSE